MNSKVLNEQEMCASIVYKIVSSIWGVCTVLSRWRHTIKKIYFVSFVANWR